MWVKIVLTVVLAIADAQQVLSTMYKKQKMRMQKILQCPRSRAQSITKLEPLLSGLFLESDKTPQPGPHREDSLCISLKDRV